MPVMRRSFAVAVLLLPFGGQLHAADMQGAQALVAHELPAVVSIYSLRIRQAEPPITMTSGTMAQGNMANGTMTAGKTAGEAGAAAAPAVEAQRSRVLGSGFIIDPTGIIVTNRHVIDDAADILVTLQDNTLLRAHVLAQSDRIDLALLKVDAAEPLPSIHFGDSDAVQVADPVLAMGNPLGLGGSVSEGIVSGLNRDISDTAFDDFIQTDAAINHGNSGGPLFNTKGEVIGMNTAIFSPDARSGSMGLGFAIPSNDVKFAAHALQEPGGMQLGTLDFRIQQVTPAIADALGMPKAEGVIVGGTIDGGAASNCGIMAGDIVLRYGTMPVKDVRAMARAVAHTRPGTVVDLTIWRNEEPTVIAATVHALPPEPAAMIAAAPMASRGGDGPVAPGWVLDPITADGGGVRVESVSAGSPAAEAGLAVGDVVLRLQQDRVADPVSIDRLLDAARQARRHTVALLVRKPDGLRWVPLSLE